MFAGAGVAQTAVVPPFEPAQLQDQEVVLLPVTFEAVPAEQRPLVGAVADETPFAEPQVPLTAVGLVGGVGVVGGGVGADVEVPTWKVVLAAAIAGTAQDGL